ncbi:MAG: glycosyltransferase family A protein [Armatimonadota bacterium]|nr:glycosyltransferase family A protein [Armatimonadota bacterium]
MRFSLILCTIGRSAEVGRFVESLVVQSHQDWELVVVDQNADDRVRAVLANYDGRFAIAHLRAPAGLSRARNAGFASAAGDIIAFPDDDCWYSPSVLEQVARYLSRRPECDGVTGRTASALGQPTSGRWSRRAGRITRYNCWWRGVSCSLFLRRHVVEGVGPFDESLGVGAGTPWGSAEEIDYVLRALKAGFRLHYDPTIVVNHENPVGHYDAGAVRRAYHYGMGIGRVLRLHRFPIWFALYQCSRPLGGSVFSHLMGRSDRAGYYWAGFRGRVRGVWYRPSDRERSPTH